MMAPEFNAKRDGIPLRVYALQYVGVLLEEEERRGKEKHSDLGSLQRFPADTRV